jgi:hypothetical protein
MNSLTSQLQSSAKTHAAHTDISKRHYITFFHDDEATLSFPLPVFLETKMLSVLPAGNDTDTTQINLLTTPTTGRDAVHGTPPTPKGHASSLLQVMHVHSHLHHLTFHDPMAKSGRLSSSARCFRSFGSPPPSLVIHHTTQFAPKGALNPHV